MCISIYYTYKQTCMYTYICVLCVYVTYTEIYRYSISYIVIYKCSKLQEFSGEV